VTDAAVYDSQTLEALLDKATPRPMWSPTARALLSIGLQEQLIDITVFSGSPADRRGAKRA